MASSQPEVHCEGPQTKMNNESVFRDEIRDFSYQIDTTQRTPRIFPSATMTKGCPTIHFVWIVPPSDEAAVDTWVASHEAFMQETHSFGAGPEP